MIPVFVIEGKVHPCVERSHFVHPRYDEADVVDDGLIFHVQYTPASSLVVTPRGKNLGGNLIVRIVYHFAN